MKLKADSTGRLAIYDETVAGDQPFTDPESYPDAIRFHSQFKYFSIVKTLQGTLTLPERVTPSYSSSFLGTAAFIEDHLIGTHSQGRPAMCFGYIDCVIDRAYLQSTWGHPDYTWTPPERFVRTIPLLGTTPVYYRSSDYLVKGRPDPPNCSWQVGNYSGWMKVNDTSSAVGKDRDYARWASRILRAVTLHTDDNNVYLKEFTPYLQGQTFEELQLTYYIHVTDMF